MQSTVAITMLALVSLCAPAFCSIGDRSYDYQSCLEGCRAKNCTARDSTPLPAHLRLLLWSCEENCAYECMHEVTTQDAQSGRMIRQFYGKVRLCGIKEKKKKNHSSLHLCNYGGCVCRAVAICPYTRYPRALLGVIFRAQWRGERVRLPQFQAAVPADLSVPQGRSRAVLGKYQRVCGGGGGGGEI